MFMVTEKPQNNTPSKAPEKLSGHDLVNYLIDHPDARGNFKWHTLRSCMWHNLLIAQPGFADVADFKKINHWDSYKILCIQPQLADHFDWQIIWSQNRLKLFIKYPELVKPETANSMYHSDWSILLTKHPHLYPLAPLEDFSPCCWITAIRSQIMFAAMCPWKRFRPLDWENMLLAKKECLAYLKLQYLFYSAHFRNILCSCYFGETQNPKGAFQQKIPDAATFMIYKRMDRVNAKKYLKKQLYAGNWSFIEELAALSPEDVMDVYGKKYMQFYFTLMAPDAVFEKLVPFFDLELRDPAGNTLLMPAVTRTLCSDSANRYNYFLQKGFDPEEKNLAGFSCSDVIEHFKNKAAAAEKGKRRVR